MKLAPADVFKLFTMLLSMGRPRGDYGHAGTRPGKGSVLKLGHSRPPSVTQPSLSSLVTTPRETAVTSDLSERATTSSINEDPTSLAAQSSPTETPTSTSAANSTRASLPTTARNPVSTYKPVAEQKCPEGSSWFVLEHALASVDKKAWSLDAANGALISFEDGMKMTLNQSARYVTLTSLDSWVPPVTVEADIKAAGVGGIPSALAMKGLGNEGAEIDLEIVAYQLGGQDKATYQMQLPIWKPSGETGKTAIRLKKDRSELADTTSNGCYEDSGNPNVKAWAYTYEKYDARQWTSYKLEWFDKHIKWHSGGLERVSFENKKASSFPRTPLPLTLGPWATSQGNTGDVGWAGQMNWDANPTASMSVRNVRLSGCRADPK